ncbi:hypothetical protein SLS53_001880 [Cytospora paraplurivora]|uniref:EthD domain-containing protein n=1 Tax=Cytospora paraplurivora TaxID=2898453 RepID=A0AAN9UP78_9PEZI
MTYSVLIYAYRKPGTIPEQFRTHYEGSHVPLVKDIAGDKAEGTERNANNPATVLSGTQAEFDYDAIAELTFADSGAFQTFFGLVQQPENAAWIAADEEKFLDRSKVPVVVLGETLVTTK